MSTTTLLNYLCGRRDAILRVANTPGALWLGAVFVFSAAFAREYDAKDLLSEPWYLLVPLVASLATSFILYGLVYVVTLRRSLERLPFWATYRRFLTLYWMTAPLAWLYALPVEHYSTAADSVRANLMLLAIVSLWRVSLMVRVITVLFGAGTWGALFIVMLFGDSIALLVLFFTPVPIFNVMGGIPLSESESLIQFVALTIGLVGAALWLVWFFGVILMFSLKGDWHPAPEESELPRRVTPSLWCLAGLSIVVWSAILPFTQPLQRLRHEIEQQLIAGQISDALSTMSRHKPTDFPPHWNPPPWLAYADPQPPLMDVMEVLLELDVAPWVREIYDERFKAQLSAHLWSHFSWHAMPNEERNQYLAILERLPDSSEFIEQHAAALEELWKVEDDLGRKDRFRALLHSVGHDVYEPATDASPSGESANGNP